MRLALTLAVGVLVAGCAPTTEAIPSESEAEAFLATVVELASEGQLDELCSLGGSNCERIRDDAGPVPDQPPTVVGTRELQPVIAGDSVSTGGRVLELCGDGLEGPFYTEILVFREDGQLLAIEPIYWSGFRIETDGRVGDPQLDAATRCQDKVTE